MVHMGFGLIFSWLTIKCFTMSIIKYSKTKMFESNKNPSGFSSEWLGSHAKRQWLKSQNAILFLFILFIYFPLFIIVFFMLSQMLHVVYINMKLHFSTPSKARWGHLCWSPKRDKGTTCYCWKSEPDRILTWAQGYCSNTGDLQTWPGSSAEPGAHMFMFSG